MRLVLFIILMALPACAALPYDGRCSARLSTRIQQGAACRCEAVCQ